MTFFCLTCGTRNRHLKADWYECLINYGESIGKEELVKTVKSKHAFMRTRPTLTRVESAGSQYLPLPASHDLLTLLARTDETHHTVQRNTI